MPKLSDAQKRVVELMWRWGYATRYMQRAGWYIQCYYNEDVSDDTMLSLARLGIVQIDGDTARLIEKVAMCVQEKVEDVVSTTKKDEAKKLGECSNQGCMKCDECQLYDHCIAGLSPINEIGAKYEVVR